MPSAFFMYGRFESPKGARTAGSEPTHRNLYNEQALSVR